jgi:hypothetical protein
MIINLSKLLMPSLDHCKFMITFAKLNICLVSIWNPTIPRIYLINNATCKNWALCITHHIKGFSQSLGFTCKHRNIFNSFFNNECIASSFETLNPKNRSSYMEATRSKRATLVGFKNL